MMHIPKCPGCGCKAEYENDVGPDDAYFVEYVKCPFCGLRTRGGEIADEVNAWATRERRVRGLACKAFTACCGLYVDPRSERCVDCASQHAGGLIGQEDLEKAYAEGWAACTDADGVGPVDVRYAATACAGPNPASTFGFLRRAAKDNPTLLSELVQIMSEAL